MSTAVLERPAVRQDAARRDATINLRLPTRTRDLIDAAAAALGKNRTEFIIESARQHAVDVLLDQRFFALTEEQHEAFLRVLDNPPPPNEKLKQLLARKAPWER